MTEINLLPWREQKREREKKKFITYLTAGLIIAAVIVFLINSYASHLVDMQTKRNQRLQAEINQLDRQIEEIKSLKKLRQALIARMNIVQDLQASRILTVHLLDEIIKIMPEGIYLYRVERVSNKVTITGYAESNTDISQLMRSIENSVWLQEPKLVEIKKSSNKETEENEFKLSFLLKSKTMLGSTP